jgi:flavodoxin
MKQVLVIYYTQSGQLKQIAQQVALPLENSESVEVTFYEIVLEKPFPFPWDKESFLTLSPNRFCRYPQH